MDSTADRVQHYIRTIAIAQMATSIMTSPVHAPYFAALAKQGGATAAVQLAEEIMAAAEASAAKAKELQDELEKPTKNLAPVPPLRKMAMPPRTEPIRAGRYYDNDKLKPAR